MSNPEFDERNNNFTYGNILPKSWLLIGLKPFLFYSVHRWLKPTAMKNIEVSATD